MADLKPTRTKRSARRAESFGRRLAMALFVSGLILTAGFASAESFTENFNSPNPSWKVSKTDPHVKTRTHRRSPEHGKDSVGEQVVLETDRQGQTIRLEHTLPKARVLNELEVGLWARPDAPGLQVHLHVTLPGCEDPSNGKTVSMLIPGDIAEEAGEWQRLTCRTDDKLVQKRLQLLRAKLKRTLTPKVMVVDRVILTWPLSAGVTELSLDELTFGPLVRVEDSEIVQTGHEQESGAEHPAQLRLDRLEVESKPFFSRIAVYHGEPLKDLAAAGFNVVLIPDYKDQALLRSIREAGLWATAIPPTAEGTDGDAGLLPFSAESRSIAFWMLGTRLSPLSQNRLVKWVDQIQEADQKFRRPIAADVSGDESLFSRELDLIGISRHTMGSSLTLRDYRDWMYARRASARPGSLCWTWIQVTPAPAVATLWEQHQIPVQLEPEQIRLQVYAALAAGMRGLGFWTHRLLNEETSADRETLLALHQINWELWLMEPWLATASGASRTPLIIESNDPKNGTTKPPPKFKFNKKSKMNTPDALPDPFAAEPEQATANDQQPPGLSAAVLRTPDKGTLLLPMWLEDRSQFVPGQLAASQVSMIVPGIDETAAAWEITTTGVRSLDSTERQRVNGGVKVTLKNFDQTACVLLTSDRELIEQTRQRIASIAEQSARTYLALADLKLERVRVIDQMLGDAGLRQMSGPHILGQARMMYDEARAALSHQDWQKVRLRSKQALQMARALQREHWDDAVRNLPSPVASPYAIGFQSLPLQARLATQMNDEQAANLLPTGNFEDADALFPVGWKHEQDAPDYIKAEAEVSHESHRGKHCLRLHSQLTSSQAQAAPSRSREFVRIVTPPITVHAGHAVRVAGWIKLPAEIPGSQDGVMIYDNLFGRNLALRFRETCDWQRFELVREAAESKDVTVTIALTGLGEVCVDDLQITVHSLMPVQQASAREPAGQPRSAAPGRPWSKLKRLNPLPTRRAVPKP